MFSGQQTKSPAGKSSVEQNTPEGDQKCTLPGGDPKPAKGGDKKRALGGDKALSLGVTKKRPLKKKLTRGGDQNVAPARKQRRLDFYFKKPKPKPKNNGQKTAVAKKYSAAPVAATLPVATPAATLPVTTPPVVTPSVATPPPTPSVAGTKPVCLGSLRASVPICVHSSWMLAKTPNSG